MDIRLLEPLRDFMAIRALWNACLGDIYPVTDRVLQTRLFMRPNYLPGDSLVAMDGGRLVGCILAETDPLQPASSALTASILAVCVSPSARRRGIGRALVEASEARMRVRGVRNMTVSTTPWRFWTGVPDNCAGVDAFFTACSYALGGEVIDLCGTLESFALESKYLRAMEDQEVTVRSARFEDMEQLFPFLQRESPGWLHAAMVRFAAGDAAHILLVEHRKELVGCIQTFPPESRVRGANLVWEGIYGERMGGFGAVLMAPAWRGKGLGASMCQQAAWYLKQCGATHCYIDWTNHDLARLYGKVGATICRTFRQAHKTLA